MASWRSICPSDGASPCTGNLASAPHDVASARLLDQAGVWFQAQEGAGWSQAGADGGPPHSSWPTDHSHASSVAPPVPPSRHALS